jgi:hypothetical protein
MEIEVDHYLWGQRKARAEAVHAALTEREMTHAVVPDGFNSTFPARDFRRQEVVFPTLPALDDVMDAPPANESTTR